MMRELSELTEAPPDEVIRQVLDRSGYRRMLLRTAATTRTRSAWPTSRNSSPPPSSSPPRTPARTIGDFLENITLASDVDGWDEQQDCVSVMTMHAAKGLEFPVVYMVAVEQGILPHERSLGRDEEVEEERRLAFVGMTRAKEELYLCHARMREFRGKTLYAVPSMFLDELPRGGDRAHRPVGQRRRHAARDGRLARRRRRPREQGWTDAGVRPGRPPSRPGRPRRQDATEPSRT